MSAKRLDELLKELLFNIEAVIKSDLSEVILYGSYARGDFDKESDIDIAVIVDSSRELLRKYHKGLVEIMSNASLEYDIVVNISCIPLKDFEEYREVLPYYRNIDSEGVRVSCIVRKTKPLRCTGQAERTAQFFMRGNILKQEFLKKLFRSNYECQRD